MVGFLAIDHNLGDALAVDCYIAVVVHLCSGQFLNEFLDIILLLGVNNDGTIGTFVTIFGNGSILLKHGYVLDILRIDIKQFR